MVVSHEQVKSKIKDEVVFDRSGKSIVVTLQPLAGENNVTLYGVAVKDMLLLITKEPTRFLKVGCGVRVNAGVDEPPDYSVEYSVTFMKHTLAHIRFVPEAKRGSYAV